eukprot:1159012-Pelagomonas_calceolata.AAC.1
MRERKACPVEIAEQQGIRLALALNRQDVLALQEMQRNRLFDVLLAIRGRMYSPRGMCKEFRDAVLALVLQVDQKLNEELMGQEVDALMKCVDQHKAMLQDQMLDE